MLPLMGRILHQLIGGLSHYLQGLYHQPIFAGFHPLIVVRGYDQPVGTATTEMAQVVAETYPGHAFYGPCGLHHHRCFTLADVLQMAGQGTCFFGGGKGFSKMERLKLKLGKSGCFSS